MKASLSTAVAAFALSFIASPTFAQSDVAPAATAIGATTLDAVQERAPVLAGVRGVYVSDNRGGDAYRYSGTHAGGPANALRKRTAVRPIEHHATGRAYRYSGTHAGGPANALRSNTAVRPVERRATSPSYRYSGTHAGGPANDVSRR